MLPPLSTAFVVLTLGVRLSFQVPVDESTRSLDANTLVEPFGPLASPGLKVGPLHPPAGGDYRCITQQPEEQQIKEVACRQAAKKFRSKYWIWRQQGYVLSPTGEKPPGVYKSQVIKVPWGYRYDKTQLQVYNMPVERYPTVKPWEVSDAGLQICNECQPFGGQYKWSTKDIHGLDSEVYAVIKFYPGPYEGLEGEIAINATEEAEFWANEAPLLAKPVAKPVDTA